MPTQNSSPDESSPSPIVNVIKSQRSHSFHNHNVTLKTSSIPIIHQHQHYLKNHSKHHHFHQSASFEPITRSRRMTINKNQNLNTSKFNFTIVISFVTLAFFCCQLPCRIFLLWSYLKHYFAPPLMDAETSGASVIEKENDLFYINLISHLSTFIYFLHCISNPIIYNILSIKFRKAFLSMTTFNKSNECRISFKV